MEIRLGEFGVYKNEEYELMLNKDLLTCSLIIRKENITDMNPGIDVDKYLFEE